MLFPQMDRFYVDSRNDVKLCFPNVSIADKKTQTHLTGSGDQYPAT